MTPFILLDDARAQTARLYRDFIRRDTLAPADLDALDDLLRDGWAQGLYATLRIPYAFGFPLVHLDHAPAPLALDWYARLDHLQDDAIEQYLATLDDGAPAGLLPLAFEQDADTHAAIIARIHEHIRAGDVYQINHTLRARGEYYGAPAALYRQLRARQPAPYAALAYHPDDGHTLCLSPELFLKREGERLHTLPMKGTARAAGDIAAAKAALQADEKNRAENAMIVDLLRNDLSRIARPFGVTVSEPFHVAQHGQILQMTSRVNAELRDGITHADILRATFPCGSITGAPKRMAMHLIDQLEASPRGLYTGALGYLEPEQFCLNVAIRTLILQDGHATFGTGAGITIDSRAADEYREYQLKAAFLHAPPAFGLIETLRVENGVAQHLAQHLDRLARSARDLHIPHDRARLQQALTATLAQRHGNERLKITLHPDGQHHIQLAPLLPLPASNLAHKKPLSLWDSQSCEAERGWGEGSQHTSPLLLSNEDRVRILLHPEPLPARDPLRRYKTTRRAHLDALWQHAETQDAFDALLFNTRDQLLEGARSNVFVQINGTWHTPPLTLDILPGIARARLLAHPESIGANRIHETTLTRADLAHAERIILCNSLRGILAAHLPDNPSVE
ncbi:MAG: bifunctional anthranilate synthase component I family protein/class IV aminotransferase [Cardiobacteriaceae bacterium]|nr:bifunctional anthranilate synthase component I family protein/class IV aminotransferase [Cardiobacteriaceae bacterium]